MRDDNLAILLFICFITTLVGFGMGIWVWIFIAIQIYGREGGMLLIMYMVEAAGAIGLYYAFYGIYDESNSYNGSTRKIYRDKKKIGKLKNKKNRLENKEQNQEKAATLSCEIKQLKAQIKKKGISCPKCQTVVRKGACFCQKCGHNF